MCRKISFLLLFLTVFSLFTLPMHALSLSAKSAILIEGQSGEVIYEKNACEMLSMASTTKIMTAIVALESGCDLDKKYKIPPEAIGIEGSSIYLTNDEELSLRELLYALMLESANDSAVAIAIIAYESLENFVEKMNEKAAELNLSSTHFENPHGLDAENHHSSASDLAHLAKYALENELFAKIVKTRTYKIGGENTLPRTLVNHNKLLRLYDGASGVKTGYTKKTGRCLVSSASREGVDLIAVTLNAPSDWHDHAELFDYGFSLYESVSLADIGDYTVELPILNGKKSTVLAVNNSEFSFTQRRGEGNFYAVLEPNGNLSAPIYKGDSLGKIVFYKNDEKIGETNIVSLENIKKKEEKRFLTGLIDYGKNKIAKIFHRPWDNVAPRE
ncbi:MAG: D-alanyl-D-alanine carboxypeptidase [Clostridia bacterium]|nr:D-alanyl-D-alanine carboxypeptidase [Clostridia bacterium]